MTFADLVITSRLWFAKRTARPFVDVVENILSGGQAARRPGVRGRPLDLHQPEPTSGRLRDLYGSQYYEALFRCGL